MDWTIQASTCPNCGKNDFNDQKKDAECEHCGFKKPPINELPPISLVYCRACGCHYSNLCDKHDISEQDVKVFK